MDNEHLRALIKNNTVIDPLLIVAAHKGYQWLIAGDMSEKEACKFEEYIISNTSKDEIDRLREKKELKNFLTGKYVAFLSGI